jgi:hypothetical protein
VPSKVIFWTELSCWRKSYSSKATLLIDWSHCYKNSAIVITIWLTVTKFSYLKWQWIFYFLRRCFLSSITGKTFTGLDCIMWVTRPCPIRSRNCLRFASTTDLLVRSVLLIFFSFCCCPIMCLYVPCCDVRYDFRIKTMFGSSFPPVICRRPLSYLRYFCLFS